MSNIRLQASGLHASYGQKTVLHGIDLDLRAGEIVGLIGPNGAGKSSLIRVLAGLHPVNSGRVEANGVNVQQKPAAARGVIGMVPQDVTLFDELSAEETLLLTGRLRNLKGEVLRGEVRRWLTLAELDGVGKAMAKYYSGGMRRKLALGAALIGAPPILLLDESFAGLDPEGTQAMEQELQRHANLGTAILLCSHRLELLERIADRVVLMQDGRVTQTLTRSGIERLKTERNSSLLQWYLDAVSQDEAELEALPAHAADDESQTQAAPEGTTSDEDETKTESTHGDALGAHEDAADEHTILGDTTA